MGLGDFTDFLGGVLEAGVQNLPAIVSAVRGPTSPQAQSFGPLVGPNIIGTSLERALGLQPSGAPPMGALPAGFQPALFNPSRTGGRPNPKRIAWSFAGGQARAWTYRGRPILFSGDLRLARRFGRIAGFTLSRKRPSVRYRRRRS